MQPKKSHLDQVEQTMMSAFGVQPDWYKDYWLEPKASRPIRGRWRGSTVLLRTILCAAIVSIFVYFGR
jgi:hypothetical protein